MSSPRDAQSFLNSTSLVARDCHLREIDVVAPSRTNSSAS